MFEEVEPVDPTCTMDQDEEAVEQQQQQGQPAVARRKARGGRIAQKKARVGSPEPNDGKAKAEKKDNDGEGENQPTCCCICTRENWQNWRLPFLSLLLFFGATAGLLFVVIKGIIDEWAIDAGSWVAIIGAYAAFAAPLFAAFTDWSARQAEFRREKAAENEANRKEIAAEKEAGREALRMAAQEELKEILPLRRAAYKKLHSILFKLYDDERNYIDLQKCVGNNGIYYSLCVFSRVKPNGTIQEIRKLLKDEQIEQREALQKLLLGQISIAIDQLQKEMGSLLQSPLVQQTILQEARRKAVFDPKKNTVEFEMDG